MAHPGKTFRVFVSSTFQDLKEERNALQQYVFPRLLELCLRHGCRFQAIDLRWGIANEASRDQRTVEICLEEIKHCQRVTPRANFIALLGDRYGWRPLPAEIPVEEFERIRQHVTVHDRALFDWYRRDDNAVSAVYCLQPRTGEFLDYDHWEPVERRLHSVLLRAAASAALPASQQLKYSASATEQEIVRGVLSTANPSEQGFCFFRSITNRDALIHRLPSIATNFIDVKESEGSVLLERLKQRLREALPGSVHEYQAVWQGDGISHDHIGDLPAELDDCLRLLEDEDTPPSLCIDVWRELARAILDEIEHTETRDPLAIEIDAHHGFGRERIEFFTGRTSHLDAIDDYVRGTDQHTLTLWGQSGSGKSTLMARATEQVTKNYPHANVIVRFIGATPASTDGRNLLDGLCREIGRFYPSGEADVPTDYSDLIQEFAKRLAAATRDRPVVVFIDGLDQLSDSHRARNLTWLPATLPEHARLIVSTVAGECLPILRAKVPAGNMVQLESMSAEEGRELLRRWLEHEGRTLQPHQHSKIVDAFDSCPLPLYLALVFEEAKHWRSYAPDIELGSDTAGMIQRLFERLSAEKNHGETLVSRSLGFMVAAKHGLSEDELLDVLAEDEEVFADLIRRSRHRPPAKRLPAVVWSRLYFDLEPYLIERHADGVALLTLYHQEMRDGAARLYLDGGEKRARHRSLAQHFRNQPLRLETAGTPSPNLRKLSELPFQQTNAESWDDLHGTLTDFEFLETKATYGAPLAIRDAGNPQYKGIYAVQDDFQLALKHLPEERDSHRRERIRLLGDALRAQSHNILHEARFLYQQVRYQLALHGRQDVFHKIFLDEEARYDSQRRTWLKPLQIATRPMPLFTLSGHTGCVVDCAISPDGMLAATTGQDLTVRIWDLKFAEVIHVLGKPMHLHVHRDPQAIARYTLLRMMTGYDGTIRACAFSRDGAHLVSVGPAEAVTIWHVRSGSKVCEISEIRGRVQACLLTDDLSGVVIFSSNEEDKWIATAYRGHTGERVPADDELRVYEAADVVQAIGSPNGRTLVFVTTKGLPSIQEVPSADEQGVLAQYIWLNRHDRYGGLATKGRALALSNQYLLFSAIRDVHVIDVTSRRHLHVLEHEDDMLVDCAVAHTAPVAATSTLKKNTIVWNLESGREIMRLDLGETVHACAFAPDDSYVLTADGNLLTEDFSGRGGLLRAWPVVEQVDKRRSASGAVTRFFHDARSKSVLHVTENGSVVLHDAEKATFELQSRITDGCLIGGKLFVAMSEGGLKYVDLARPESGVKILSDAKLRNLTGSGEDGFLAAWNHERETVEVWDARTLANLLSQRCPVDDVRHLFFSPDSSLIVAIGRSRIDWLSVSLRRFAPLLDGREIVDDGWEHLRHFLAAKAIPARPLDPSNYREEFLDGVMMPNGSGLLTVSCIAPQGDPHAFQFVFTEHGMDSARHMDPFPRYVLLSAWSFESRTRIWFDAVDGEHHQIRVSPDGSIATWLTRFMGAFSIRNYDAADGRLAAEERVGLDESRSPALTLGRHSFAAVDTHGRLSIHALSDLTSIGSAFISDRGLTSISLMEESGIVFLGYESGEVDSLQMRNVERPVPASESPRELSELFAVNLGAVDLDDAGIDLDNDWNELEREEIDKPEDISKRTALTKLAEALVRRVSAGDVLRRAHTGVPIAGGESAAALDISIPTPHPAADPESASRINIEYQRAYDRWRALPWWKRWRVRAPDPPIGI